MSQTAPHHGGIHPPHSGCGCDRCSRSRGPGLAAARFATTYSEPAAVCPSMSGGVKRSGGPRWISSRTVPYRCSLWQFAFVNAGAVAREARILSAGRAPEEPSSSLANGAEPDIRQLAKGRVTLGDVWDALESAGLRPHQGALGTAYFALSDDRHVGIPNRGFFDQGIASDEILALIASWGVRPTESGEYPMPANATPQMCQPVRLKFATPSG